MIDDDNPFRVVVIGTPEGRAGVKVDGESGIGLLVAAVMIGGIAFIVSLIFISCFVLGIFAFFQLQPPIRDVCFVAAASASVVIGIVATVAFYRAEPARRHAPESRATSDH
jgi:hypothetical protein